MVIGISPFVSQNVRKPNYTYQLHEKKNPQNVSKVEAKDKETDVKAKLEITKQHEVLVWISLLS